MVAEQDQEIAALKRENSYLVEVNQQLIASVDNEKQIAVRLERRVQILEDRNAVLVERFRALSPVIDRARGIMAEVTKYHHLGAYRLDANKAEPIGTFTGYLGLHPLDCETMRPRPISPGAGQPPIVTYDWRATNIPHEFFYWALIRPPLFAHEFEYPNTTLAGMIVEAYDSNPPTPRWHQSGLIDQVLNYRVSLLEPHLAVENGVMLSTLKQWRRRVEPVLLSMCRTMEFLATVNIPE